MKKKTEKMYVVTHHDNNEELSDKLYDYINVKQLYPIMNRLWNEWCAMDYVYKNHLKHDLIGFCHYRRIPAKETLNNDIASCSMQYFHTVTWDYSKNYDWMDFYFKRLNSPDFFIQDAKEYLNKQTIIPKDSWLSYIQNNPFVFYNRNIFYTNWEMFCEFYHFINGYIEHVEEKYNLHSDTDWFNHVRDGILANYRKNFHKLHKKPDYVIDICWASAQNFINVLDKDYGWSTHLNCWRLYAYMIETLAGIYINYHKPTIEGYENSDFITNEHVVDICW